MLTSPFEARDGALRGSHALRDRVLSETSTSACLQELARDLILEEFELNTGGGT